MKPSRRARRVGVITLYGPRNAPFVEKVARALRLKGLAFELQEPRERSDYRRMSPVTGLLPAIDIDGERVHDSTAILLRLEQLWPHPPLLARDARTAAAQRRLEDWADESLSWFWTRWQYIREEAEAAGRRSESRGMGWLRKRMRLRARSTPEARAERLVEELGRRVDDLAQQLADRSFFYSDRVSMGDLAVYSILKTTARDGIPGARRTLARQPRLMEFMKRVEEATGGAD